MEDGGILASTPLVVVELVYDSTRRSLNVVTVVFDLMPAQIFTKYASACVKCCSLRDSFSPKFGRNRTVSPFRETYYFLLMTEVHMYETRYLEL